ncbi:MAG: ECF-type sigma factor [Phycisphaerales bacterium]
MERIGLGGGRVPDRLLADGHHDPSDQSRAGRPTGRRDLHRHLPATAPNHRRPAPAGVRGGPRGRYRAKPHDCRTQRVDSFAADPPVAEPGPFLRRRRAVRRVLVDEALKRKVRRKHAPRIGDRFCWSAGENGLAHRIDPASPDLIMLANELIDRLQRVESRWAQVASMHYFLGLDPKTIAGSLGIDVRTVQRDLEFFRAWLHRQWSFRESLSRDRATGA